jgi:aspartyl-tRNA(Asn)/glutamyl-tRNA(Gln) amidotransferase subunit C
MSSTVITDDQFQHIAKLSRLEIRPEESFIKDQLSQAAEYVEVLKELNTDDVKPTYQVNHKKNVVRDDIITASLPQKLALSQAKEIDNGYFKTAATIKK